MPRKGQCTCGAVRYSVTQPAKFSYLCQCRQCQRTTGTGHDALFMVEATALSITGELREFEQRADSGNTMARKFCLVCGTIMMQCSSGYPHLRFIPAGTLDDPRGFKPTQVIWHSAAQPWDVVDPALKVNAGGV